GERNNDQVREHLMKCESCTGEFEALTAERELYQRYDRDLQISPAIWNGIAARIAENRESVAKPKSNLAEWFAGLFAIPRFGFAIPAVALVAIALVLGLAYWRTRQPVAPPDKVARSNDVTPPNVGPDQPTGTTPITATAGDKHPDEFLAAKIKRPASKNRRGDNQSDVLFTDAAYTSVEDRDTATHLQQAQDLLVSIRNIQLSDDDQEVDVSYEKAESRRLLNENVVLRRDAEMAGKFPAKSVLGSLEPFLIDIANLPEKATPNDVRQIKDRVQKTEIVAELRGY
ncbi:MAG TPA: anti-sigma factor, partial [Pyrinomonadaceae bacterium]